MADTERREDDFPAPNAESDGLPSNVFLAALAHEIRNPLTPILGSAQVLRSLSTDPRQQHAIAIIEQQVVHLTHLMDSLIDAADLRRGELNLTMQWVDAARLAQQAIDAVRVKMEERRQNFFATLPAASVQMQCDPRRLMQVIQTLLDNAHRCTPESGSISLAVANAGGHLTIEVSDDGYGIEPEQLPDVFNLFVPGRARLHHTAGSSGVSLAIARNLVELHGGSIAANSKGVGHGSCFTVRLPIKQAEPVPPGPATSPMRSHRKILIVEDNESVAKDLAGSLAELGYAVVIACDGASAIRLADEFKPEVAIIDIGLPDREGYEVAFELRGMPAISNALLIAVTGYHLRAFRQVSDHRAFDHYLLKPVSASAIAALIRHVMND